MSRRVPAEITLIPAAPLLITESAKDFAEMHDALNQEIRPQGIIEKMFVTDIAHFNWEILRLWRCRSTIVNVAYKSAIKEILRMLCMRNSEIYNDADDLSLRWFTDEDARGEVLDVLRGFHLDEFRHRGASYGTIGSRPRLAGSITSVATGAPRQNPPLHCRISRKLGESVAREQQSNYRRQNHALEGGLGHKKSSS